MILESSKKIETLYEEIRMMLVKVGNRAEMTGILARPLTIFLID